MKTENQRRREYTNLIHSGENVNIAPPGTINAEGGDDVNSVTSVVADLSPIEDGEAIKHSIKTLKSDGTEPNVDVFVVADKQLVAASYDATNNEISLQFIDQNEQTSTTTISIGSGGDSDLSIIEGKVNGSLITQSSLYDQTMAALNNNLIPVLKIDNTYLPFGSMMTVGASVYVYFTLINSVGAVAASMQSVMAASTSTSLITISAYNWNIGTFTAYYISGTMLSLSPTVQNDIQFYIIQSILLNIHFGNNGYSTGTDLRIIYHYTSATADEYVALTLASCTTLTFAGTYTFIGYVNDNGTTYELKLTMTVTSNNYTCTFNSYTL